MSRNCDTEMELLIDEESKTSIRSLYDGRLSVFPDEIPIGDTMPLSVAVVDRIDRQFSGRKFTPQDLSGVVFWAALGIGFGKPVAGTTKATFTASDNSTESSASIPFNFDANDLQGALNDIGKISAIGGVVVDQPDEDDPFYVVRFNNVGARNLLSFDPTDLVPLSIVDVQRAAIGNVSTREVQIVRVVQNAGAINVIDAVAASAGITITPVQAGGVGVNAQFRVALTGNIYSGSWTFSKTSGTGGTSAAILYDDTVAQIRAKLEATTGIGAGNVSIVQEDESKWLIEFIGSLANTAISAGANGSNLIAIPERTGTLDCRTPGLEILLNGSREKVVRFEIQKTSGANPPTKILTRDVLLVRPTIEPAMSIPQRGAFFDLFGSSPNLIVAAATPAGGINLSPSVAKFAQWVQRIIAQAGVGPYLAKFALGTTAPTVGAVYRIPMEIQASANPTLEFYDNATSGTLLLQLVGDSSNPQYRTAIFVFQDDLHWHWTGFEQ